MMTKRRSFLQLASGLGLGLAMTGTSWLAWARELAAANTVSVPSNTGSRGRVVVIGGGMAGATVAKYLRLWGGSGVQVTLIERAPYYTSNIMSNLVLNGQRSLESLRYDWNTLVSRYGVQVLRGEVVSGDPYARQVILADGRRLSYDRLVVAPGIDFDLLPGLESAEAQAKVPHAWQAGPQTTLLRNQILAMPSGGVFVLTIPPKPYRCPPGPYERACVVADWLKRNRPGSKVIVLDANAGITAEAHTFSEAFNVTHAGVIEYYSGVSIEAVDAANMRLFTSLGEVRGHVLNVIPPQRAGRLLVDHGLADDATGRWTRVDVLSYEALAAPGLHVIGDAAATTQPKAGQIANQEAKVCADAIIRLLAGQAPDPAPVTHSACYSPITAETASWLTAVYAYDPASRSMQISHRQPIEANRPSKENYRQMGKWFTTLMADSFA